MKEPETQSQKKGMRAYKDNVVVLLDSPKERKTSGGILLPDSMDNSQYGEKVLSGVVIRVGPGGKDDDGQEYRPDVKLNERVLIHSESGQECVVGDDCIPACFPDVSPGTELRICRFDELLSVVE